LKKQLLLLFLLYSVCSYSQCFDCGQSLGGHVEDYAVDIDKASDGIILTFNPGQGWGRSIYKYDFNCNLIWANDFNPDTGSTDNTGFFNTTVDENDNIYSVIGNNRGGVVIDGFSIEKGNSLIKLNSSGNILWVRKISDERYLPRKVHVWNNNVFVIGQLDEAINTNIGLTVATGSRSQYFIAKFDASGNLIDAQQYGTESDETFHDSQIDENGSIYFTGTVTPRSYSSNIKTYLNKIDSNLSLIWSKEMSDNQPARVFKPMTLYYNKTNQKLYVWSKYYVSASFYSNNVAVSNGCDTGSVLMEISKNSGELEDYKVIDNCGFLQSVGNGIGNVEQRSFITHEDSNLYVLSSFRGEITIGSETLTTTRDIHGDHNSDLILYEIDLTNFSEKLILRSTGENYYPSLVYRDLAGPIIAVNNSIHITSSFMSYPITINGLSIENNSGNNSRDVLYYKHNLDQTNPDALITFEETCTSQETRFSIGGNFDSVSWNFDDPLSGTDNTSSLIEPTHTFTGAGIYNVSALVTCGTEQQTITVKVVSSEKPSINQPANIYSCEDSVGSSVSSTFDTSTISNEIISSQSGLIINYFSSSGTELPSPLPNPFTNTTPGKQTIIARVYNVDNPECYAETSFDLIVNALPQINPVNPLVTCDDDTDGQALFDISTLKNDLIGNQPNLKLELFYENGQQVAMPLPATLVNQKPNAENLTARVTHTLTGCSTETLVQLVVNPLPIANPLPDLIGCDDNNDGISEYFDTSQIETLVLNGQTGMAVTYYDAAGNTLPSPLPNPYTNSTANTETLTVRVTNTQTGCYEETSLKLITSAQPQINQPTTRFACDAGNGYSSFDLSDLEQELIGTQAGLTITYTDETGTVLPTPLSASFQNTTAWSQRINIRVENATNALCYSETYIDLEVNALPELLIEDTFVICDNEPGLALSRTETFDLWEWEDPTGTIISNTSDAYLSLEGNYVLTIGEIQNGMMCTNSYAFELKRSEPPAIQKVDFADWSDNNYIEVQASGGGNFEYSIDGIHFQDNPLFQFISGGVYEATVRDKAGCGIDFKTVVLIDYKKVFTPNGDGYNDYWQIEGIEAFPDASIRIYDRYGKVLKQLTPQSVGWDGTFNTKTMPSNDYWFEVDLGNGRSYKNHFTLKR